MRLHRIATLLLALSLPAEAATLHVSPDGTGSDGLTWQTAFPTIGEAIVASATGDEVWIQSGTYEENLVVRKPLTILGGLAGTESIDEMREQNLINNLTIIDGGQNGLPIFSIQSTTAKIEGLTVKNGLAYQGSGFNILDASVTIRNVVISNNGGMTNARSGGAIYIRGGRCGLENSELRGNSAIYGGGISSGNSVISINRTTFIGNKALFGAGIRITSHATAKISSCNFIRNIVIFEYPEVGQIGSGGEGGAIGLNAAGGESTLNVQNTIFDRNTFINAGYGTIFHGKSQYSAEFDQCTCIVGADTTGFGVFRFSSLPVLRNCILVSEPNGSSTPIGLEDAIVSHSLVEGGYSGEGNIDADPKFVDFEGGDLHLQRGSSCIDSGTDTAVMTDFDGNPRPIGLYDMGAFEFPYLRSDINGDGVVGPEDLMIFQRDWGKVSGL